MKFMNKGLKMTDEEFDCLIDTTLLGVPCKFDGNGVYFLDTDMQEFFKRGGTIGQMEAATKGLLKKVTLLTDNNKFDNLTDKIAEKVADSVIGYLMAEEDCTCDACKPVQGGVQ